MTKRFFITGTDTNCGKTHVTSALIKHFTARSLRAQALKPIASGGEIIDGVLCNEDISRLQTVNADPQLEINRWRFLPAISPHIAAELEQTKITAAMVADFCNEPVFQSFDRLLIEGAGGLLAPINEKETWLDYAALAGVEVILVVGMKLGCLNHALLTDKILQQRGIPCVGWIANCLDPNMAYLKENILYLSKNLSMPLCAQVGYGLPPHFISKINDIIFG